MTAQHTPTPWRTDGRVIFNNPGNVIAATVNKDWPHGYKTSIASEEERANAAYIVKCVNAHEELLNTLQYVRKFYQDNFDIMPVAFQTVDDQIAQAIAAAEGGK
jgi:hypothetical protein